MHGRVQLAAAGIRVSFAERTSCLRQLSTQKARSVASAPGLRTFGATLDPVTDQLAPYGLILRWITNDPPMGTRLSRAPCIPELCPSTWPDCNAAEWTALQAGLARCQSLRCRRERSTSRSREQMPTPGLRSYQFPTSHQRTDQLTAHQSPHGSDRPTNGQNTAPLHHPSAQGLHRAYGPTAPKLRPHRASPDHETTPSRTLMSQLAARCNSPDGPRGPNPHAPQSPSRGTSPHNDPSPPQWI